MDDICRFDLDWFFVFIFMVNIECVEGVYFYVVDGIKILDVVGGVIVVNIGYGWKEVVDVVVCLLVNMLYLVLFFECFE